MPILSRIHINKSLLFESLSANVYSCSNRTRTEAHTGSKVNLRLHGTKIPTCIGVCTVGVIADNGLCATNVYLESHHNINGQFHTVFIR